MADTDFGLKVFGKSCRDFMNNPVLSPGRLYKNINGCNQQQEGEEKPFQYFFKPLQTQLFIVKLRNRFLQANSIPNRALLIFYL